MSKRIRIKAPRFPDLPEGVSRVFRIRHKASKKYYRTNSSGTDWIDDVNKAKVYGKYPPLGTVGIGNCVDWSLINARKAATNTYESFYKVAAWPDEFEVVEYYIVEAKFMQDLLVKKPEPNPCSETKPIPVVPADDNYGMDKYGYTMNETELLLASQGR